MPVPDGALPVHTGKDTVLSCVFGVLLDPAKAPVPRTVKLENTGFIGRTLKP